MKSQENRVQVTRIFQALRPQVFRWWTTAENLQRWTGCKEASQCEIRMDFRVGGRFSQKMQIAVNGGSCEFAFDGTYEEIVEPERIVYVANIWNARTRVTVEFEEVAQGTKVILTQEGCADEVFLRSVTQGTGESFDKLAGLMAAG